MGKSLPVVGIVAAVFGAAFSWAVVGPLVPFLVLLFLLAAALFLILERRATPVFLGVALALAGLSALLYFNPIVREGGTLVPRLPDLFNGPYQAALCVLAWVAILLARQERVEPAWMLAAGPVAAGIAILTMLFIPSNQFGNFGNGANILAGLLCLLLVAPMVLLLRAPADAEAAPTPVPPAFAPSPVRPVPGGLKPAGPPKTIPTVAAPLRKAPASSPPPAPQKRAPPK